MSCQVSVLFVCLGNICRSPTAQGIFQQQVDEAGLGDSIYIDSAGTGDWHIGRAPDPRAQQHAVRRGYDLSALRARQVKSDDFNQFDFILAMDSQNMQDLQGMCPQNYSGHLSLFLDFLHQGSGRDVPDPYYGGETGFELVIDMVEQASDNLLKHIRATQL